MKRGLFITMEGPDGSGKSTQIEKIKTFFERQGRRVVLTREPGGTDISEKIRELILNKQYKEMAPVTETFLYAAARAQHVAEVIEPALARGDCVVCDRFVDSSIAYQGYGRGLGDAVAAINQYAAGDCAPDITFLLKLSPDMAKSRIPSGERDRIESEKREFHTRVLEGYLELERECPDRIVGIDATKSIEEIGGEIQEHLERLLKK